MGGQYIHSRQVVCRDFYDDRVLDGMTNQGLYKIISTCKTSKRSASLNLTLLSRWAVPHLLGCEHLNTWNIPIAINSSPTKNKSQL